MKVISKIIATMVIISIIFANISFSAENTENIVFKDTYAYNYVVEQIKGMGISITTDDENKTITINKSDIDKITKLDLQILMIHLIQ